MKIMTPTECAIREAKQSERYKILLLAKSSDSLDTLIASLEQLINQG